MALYRRDGDWPQTVSVALNAACRHPHGPRLATACAHTASLRQRASHHVSSAACVCPHVCTLTACAASCMALYRRDGGWPQSVSVAPPPCAIFLGPTLTTTCAQTASLRQRSSHHVGSAACVWPHVCKRSACAASCMALHRRDGRWPQFVSVAPPPRVVCPCGPTLVTACARAASLRQVRSSHHVGSVACICALT